MKLIKKTWVELEIVIKVGSQIYLTKAVDFLSTVFCNCSLFSQTGA